jgi:hypothetical protein
MTDKLPWGEARKIIMEQHGSGKTAPQIAKTLNISESYVWRVWRDAEYPVVAHLDRLRRKHGQGTGTMRTVMKLLTEEQRVAIYQDATDWGVGVPTVIVSILRDAYVAPEPEKEPTAKPSVNWIHISAEFNAMATDDEDRFTYLYEKTPALGRNEWRERGRVIMASVFTSFKPGTCDWKDSLVLRPGYEEPKP